VTRVNFFQGIDVEFCHFMDEILTEVSYPVLAISHVPSTI
jgi:hypothetical protein